MSIKIGKKPAVRRFHQARWDEPVIFELSKPGQRGALVPEVEEGIRDEVIAAWQKQGRRPWSPFQIPTQTGAPITWPWLRNCKLSSPN